MGTVSAIMTATTEETRNRKPESWNLYSTFSGFFAFMDRNRRQGTATTQILEMLSSRGCAVSVCVED